MEKKKDKCGKQLIMKLFAMVLLFLGVVNISTEETWAAGEKAAFGSESYEWNLDAESPIGFYAQSDDEISSVTFSVSYDPEVISFERGAEIINSGMIQMTGTDIRKKEYRRIVYFKPKVAGDTEITIDKTTITDSNGNVTELPPVKMTIHVTIPESCQLEGIQLNGSNLENFSSEIATYTVNVKEDVEQAAITVSPSDSDVTISDTNLSEGDNRIQIMTTGESGEKACYQINIFRKKKPVVVEKNVQQNEKQDVSNIENQQETAQKKNNIFYYKKQVLVVIGFIAVLILFFCFIKRNNKKTVIVSRREDPVPKIQKKKETISGIQMQNILRQPEKVQPGYLGELEDIPGNMIVKMAANLSEEDYKNASDYMEEDEIEIDVQHVTIDFKREQDESGSVKELVIRTLKGERTTEKFRALEDISFTVKKGEVVGIIGTNGSGKSTILKIISGVLKPTKGKVITDRRKIQLLTLGTGFDRELTGKENVYLNGAIIGYTKEYIDENYDNIVKFAELEGFMDEKVKNYSSGMISRLGFAIATVRDTPEILILDEVLSVGDMFFRKKSERRIQEMIHGGSTVLIVSHSPSVIRKNCTKVVWIEKGRLRAIGDPKIVCGEYEKMQQGV